MKTVKREVKTETGQEEQGETDEGNRTPDKRWEKTVHISGRAEKASGE